MRNIRTLLRRPRVSRPVVVLVAAIVGLGGLGGAAGALFGGLGAASQGMHLEEGRHHDARVGPFGSGLERDGADGDGVLIPGQGSSR